jgi:anti-sigma factor RsiW
MYDDGTLWKLVDGELPEEESRAIEEAAGSDESLRQRILEMRSLKEGILADAPHPPPDFADRVVGRARRLSASPVVDLDDARRFLRRMLVAATVLAALGLAYLAVEIVPDLVGIDLYADNPLLRR